MIASAFLLRNKGRVVADGTVKDVKVPSPHLVSHCLGKRHFASRGIVDLAIWIYLGR